MAKYSNFLYGTAKYGEAANLAFSVEPMNLIVLDFKKVYVSWFSPTGNFTKIRLVRNQIGFSETSEDGVIIWEESATEGNISISEFIDGEDNPDSIEIVSGRPIYYTMFLFSDTKVWVRAGRVSDNVPSDHQAQKRILDILPRVYTSDIKSPLGVVEEDSTLAKFLQGMSFTYEQVLTELDLLRPRQTEDISSHVLLPSEYFSKGLIPEPNLSVKNQKILLRESFIIFSRKGLQSGVELYTEALTGYAPQITVSKNLLLSVQDSTFYKTTGNWVTSNCTLESSTDQVPATNDYTIDTVYTGKVTAAGAASITLGANDPIRKTIPVKGDTDYTFSYKVKSPTSAGNTQMIVTWRDGQGEVVGTAFTMTSQSANNTWKTSWEDTTSPVEAVYASIQITFSASGVYYIDQVYAQEEVNTDNTSYQEARAVDLFLLPNKTNFIKNPSFEVNVTDSWTLGGTATAAQDSDVSDEVYSGDYSAKITATGSWTFSSNTVTSEDNTYYTASGYIKSSASLSVKLIFKDSSSNVLDEAFYTIGTLADWSRFNLSGLTPANTATVQLQFYGSTGDYYIDNVQLEKGVSASDYFDGSLPTEYGVIWEGTDDNSFSHMYIGKQYKLLRLAQTISDYMPPNSFWRLSTYDGLEYTNLTV